MIRFKLQCEHSHKFDSWFKNNEACEKLMAASQLSCPDCGSSLIRKAPMAPGLAKASFKEALQKPGQPEQETQNSQSSQSSQSSVSASSAPAAPAAKPDLGNAPDPVALREALHRIHEHVKENCEDVGDKFADEVRKIHYGESDARGIYGQTTADEAAELEDEGIDFAVLPVPPKTDA